MNKKVLSIIYAVVLVVLATILTISTFLPALSFDIEQIDRAPGRFTKDAMSIDEVNLGLCTAFTLLANFDDFLTVYMTENNDGYLENIDKDIDNAESIEEIEALEKEKQETKAARDARLEKLTEQDYERIQTKLETDADFVNLLYVIDAAAMVIGSNKTDSSSSDVLADMLFVLTCLFFVVVLGFALIYPIIAAIKYIIKLIGFLVGLGKKGADIADSKITKTAFSVYPTIMVACLLLLALVFGVKGVSAGVGVMTAAIVWLIACVVCGVRTVLCADKNKVRVIVKKCLYILCAVTVLTMILNFSGALMLEDLRENQYTMYNEHHAALEIGGLTSAEATDKAETANIYNRVLIFLVTAAGIAVLIVAFVVLVERLKSGSDAHRNNKTMLPMAIVLLIFMIVPVIFNAPTYDAKIESFEKGIFMTCHKEYLDSETATGAKYEELNDEYDLFLGLLNELKAEREDIDEDEMAAYEELVAEGEETVANLKKQIKEIESKQQKLIRCVVMAVLFVILEIVYLLLPKIIPCKEATELPAAPAPDETSDETPLEAAVSAQDATTAQEALAEE